jgi:predicted cobalt transporter CbtA
MKTFILRGAIAGLAGSFASVLTLLLLGEPSIREAIAIEDAAAALEAGPAEEPMFSRTVQVLGGSLGMVLYGIFVGLIFGIVFAACRHRLGSGPDWRRARRFGLVAFVTVYLVPFLKYPPNPPAVGDPETVNQRTIAFLSMLALSILATYVGARVLAWARRRGWAEHLVAPAAVAAWLVVVAVGVAFLPVNTDPIEVPATLIWNFRIASAAGQLAFWTATSLVFGLLVLGDRRAVAPAASDVPVATTDA